MTDVYVYDHVRTPRGRGKKDGSLHEVPPVRLAAACSRPCATATGSTPPPSTTSFSAASIPSWKRFGDPARCRLRGRLFGPRPRHADLAVLRLGA